MAVATQDEKRFLFYEPASGLFEVSLVSDSEFRVRRLESSELSVVADFFKMMESTSTSRALPFPLGPWWQGTFEGRHAGTATAPALRQGLVAGPEAIQGTHIPESLVLHVRRLGVHDEVQTVLAAVHQVYPNALRIELSVFRDPDGDERVRVNAYVQETGDEETEKYFRCLGQWTEAISTRAAERIVFTTA